MQRGHMKRREEGRCVADTDIDAADDTAMGGRAELLNTNAKFPAGLSTFSPTIRSGNPPRVVEDCSQ